MARPLPEQLLAQSPLWAACDGGTLIVACSGGKDSVALALAASRFLANRVWNSRTIAAPRLVLWHLDHGLREDSAADAKFVEELGAKLGVPVIRETANLQEQADRDGGNIEELARNERYRRLLRLCTSPPPGSPVTLPAVAVTAHQLGDQAETVLHHIVRGTHLSGLRGISKKLEEYIYRPWLDLAPEEIEAYLADAGQQWRDDETNLDTAFTRNLLRHEVLPELLKINPRAREHIASLALAAGDARELFERELDRIHVNAVTSRELSKNLPVCHEPHAEYLAFLKLDGWGNPDLLAGYLSRWLADQLGSLTSAEHSAIGEWSADPIEPLHIRNIACSMLGHGLLIFQSDTLQDQQVIPLDVYAPGRSHFGNLAVLLAEADSADFGRHKLNVRTSALKLGGWVVALLGSIQGEAWQSEWNCFLPASVNLPLILRTWREGDRITLTDGSTKKLGDIFTDAKIPRLFRAVWTVLTDADGEVLWLPGLADGRAMKLEPPEKPAWLLKLSHGA